MNNDELHNDWIPLNKREKLSIPHLLAIAVGNFAPGLIWNIYNVYINPSLTKLGIKGWGESGVLLSGCMIGLLVGLFIGAISDRTQFKYGRRRIFIVIGIIPTVIGLCGMAFYEKISHKLFSSKIYDKGCKVVFIISVILMCFGTNLIQSPSRALCSDVTPLSQQNFMAGCCQVFAGISPIVSNLLGAFDFDSGELGHEKILIIISAVLAFLSLLIQFIAAKEEPLRVKPEKTNPIKQTYYAFKKMPRPFIRILPAFFLSNVAIFQYNLRFSSFMGHDIYGGVSEKGNPLKPLFDKGLMMAMRCNIVNNAVQLIYGFVNNKFVDKIGMKKVMIIGTFVMSVSFMCFFFVGENKKNIYFLLAGLVGFGQVIFMTIPYALVSLVIPTEELANNFGVLNSFLVFGQIFSVLVQNSIVEKIITNKGKKDLIATYDIGSACIFGFLATICSFFIVQPSLAEVGNYNQIKDTTGTSEIGGFQIDN